LSEQFSYSRLFYFTSSPGKYIHISRNTTEYSFDSEYFQLYFMKEFKLDQNIDTVLSE